jgi:hypothetical protein
MRHNNGETTMTREQLIADHVTFGVAKWGESERGDLVRQAEAKSTETLRVEYDLRHGDEAKALAASAYRQRNQSRQFQAESCLDDGPT